MAFAGIGHAYTEEAKVAERERMVGQWTMENTLLKEAYKKTPMFYTNLSAYSDIFDGGVALPEDYADPNNVPTVLNVGWLEPLGRRTGTCPI